MSRSQPKGGDPTKGSRRTYSADTKAAAMAALLAGQGVEDVAREYKIPSGTVKAWRSRMGESASPVATAKKVEIGELLIQYLHTNLETLRQQSEFFRNEVWLSKQRASEAAVLHGVIADKTIRLLEALDPSGDTDAAA